MSFIDDIIGYGKTALNFVSGNSIGSQITKTVLTGLAINKLSKSINKTNDSSKTTEIADQGVSLSVSASTENKIPVLYGRAVTGGILTDTRMTSDAKTMFFVYTVAETTGNLLSTGAPSTYTFRDIYWDGYKINFQSDGITLASIQDLEGNTRSDLAGLVKVYCYAGGSSAGQLPVGYSGPVPNAHLVVPNWTTAWAMPNLIFFIIQVDYNNEKGSNGVPSVTIDVENSMKLPGDVLYDLSTNTTYGAGIPPSDIKDI